MLKTVSWTALRVVVLVDRQSVHRPHCEDVIGPLPSSVHAHWQSRLYVPLRGSCTPSLQYAAQRKPKWQIQCIMTKRFGYNQQQNCSSRYHMGTANINSQRSDVACFGHSRSLGNLLCSWRRGIVYHRAGMPTPSVLNPTLSCHYLCLFGNVGNGSVHLLEFLVRKPIRAGTRFWKGMRSWSPGRWAV
jgi:hypothetical protein